VRILITGGSGLLALNWAVRCRDEHDIHLTIHSRDITIEGTTTHRTQLDNEAEFVRLIEKVRPELVIHTAGLTDLEKCEASPEKSEHANVRLASVVALACAKTDTSLLHLSTDHLFDGNEPCIGENAEVRPLNVYARHKAAAEAVILSHKPDALVVRTSFFGWGPVYRKSLSDLILNSLEAGEVFNMFDDVFFTALSTSRLVELSMKAVESGLSGIINICSGERISKYHFSVKLAKTFGFDHELIQPVQAARLQGKVVRPLDLSLSNKRMLSLLGVSDISTDDILEDLKQDQIARSEIGQIGKIIPYGKHYVDELDIAAVSRTLKSGFLTQGPTIAAFEERIAEYVGAKFAVAVSSATAGLHLSYLALGLGPGKAMLTSPITFVSTANAALFCGAEVRFADVNKSTINISYTEVEKMLAQDRAISIVTPVIFAGATDGIPEVATLAKSQGKLVVEDAAHGLGASYFCGALVGSCKYSDCTVFSLHPVKSIAAGEGGIVTTNNEDIYRSLLRLRSHGINKSDDVFRHQHAAYTNGRVNLWYYEMNALGYHYRLTDIQASLALSQMDKLSDFVARRRLLAHRYVLWIEDHLFIRRAQLIDIDRSANHLFTVSIDFEGIGMTRNDVMRSLRESGIITQVHYMPVVEQPYYHDRGFSGDGYPHAQKYYENTLSLPLYFSLSDDDFGYVTSKLSAMLEQK